MEGKKGIEHCSKIEIAGEFFEPEGRQEFVLCFNIGDD